MYEEATGRLIHGFDTSGNWIGAILPQAGSTFQPALYTPDQKLLDITEPVQVRDSVLKRLPLPDGAYVVSVTGFDLGGNVETEGVIIGLLAGEAPSAPSEACKPEDIDVTSAVGEHNERVDLPNLGTLTLTLTVDRNKVGRIRFVVDVFRGDTYVEFKLTGPDGQTVGASGTVYGHGTHAADLDLSGLYTLVLTDKTGGPKTVLLTWNVFPRQDLQPPSPTDLDESPDLLSRLEEPGLHVAAITVPARNEITIGLEMDPAKTPWIGYSLEVGKEGSAMPFTVLGADGKALDKGTLCGLHMGGFRVAQKSEHKLVFDNRRGAQGRLVTLWIEGYSPATAVVSSTATSSTPSPSPTPAPTATATPTPQVTVTALPEWARGDHLQEFTLAPGQVLRLVIPFDPSQTSRVEFSLSGARGSGTIRYEVLGPTGQTLASGVHTYLAQDAFAVASAGEYVLVLDNSKNSDTRTVRLSLSARSR